MLSLKLPGSSEGQVEVGSTKFTSALGVRLQRPKRDKTLRRLKVLVVFHSDSPFNFIFLAIWSLGLLAARVAGWLARSLVRSLAWDDVSQDLLLYIQMASLKNGQSSRESAAERVRV